MNKLTVQIDFGKGPQKVGELYLSESLGRYVFAYDKTFIGGGLEISPETMPLGNDTYIAKKNSDLYDLHGVFADSLPDEWGKKVQNAEFEKIGHYEVTAIDRLAFVGQFAIGALKYHPDDTFETGKDAVTLANLRKTTQSIIEGTVENVSRELLRCGGSAGGARPKFLVDLDVRTMSDIRYTQGRIDGNYVPVVLKVPTSNGEHWNRIEYAYSKMAKKCDISIPHTYLLKGRTPGPAYFAIERFDTLPDGTRLHVHSLAGMLGQSFREMHIDYRQMLRLTGDLTRNHGNVVDVYRRMVFNYLGNNRDDHAKNFSFVMNPDGEWAVSPAYDISYSPGENSLHAMAANGKRRNLTLGDFREIAQDFEIKSWKKIILKTNSVLKGWEKRAVKSGIPKKLTTAIQARIRENINRIEKDLKTQY